jgi:MFS family permease
VSSVNKIQSHRPRGGPGDLGRLRIALCAVFAAHGFMFASWAVRIPAIKEQTGASSAALGLALLGLSAGAVVTMLLAGALCRRFGSPRVTVLSCVVLSLTLPLPALAGSALTLGLLLAGFGAAYGCLNVAMNSVAVDFVIALRRPVMPGFHAAWSVGGLAGAGLGGLLAPHLSPLRQLLLVALAGLLVSVLAGRVLLTRSAVLHAAASAAVSDAASAGPASGSNPTSGRDSTWRGTLRTGRTVGLFGLIALCAAYDEGAIGDWGALHLRQDLGAVLGCASFG